MRSLRSISITSRDGRLTGWEVRYHVHSNEQESDEAHTVQVESGE